MKHVLVFVGAGFGGLLRLWVAEFWPRATGGWPWATLLVNLLGALLLGLVVGWTGARADAEPWRWLLVVGVAGGFTTFSAFSHELLTLAQRPDGPWLALGYALVSLVAGVAAVATGLLLGRTLA